MQGTGQNYLTSANMMMTSEGGTRRPFHGGLGLLCLFVVIVVVMGVLRPFALCAAEVADSLPQVDVPVVSYMVKETGSSRVLLAKDIDRPVSPASLTKIMTCMMAIESGRLDQNVLITREATEVEPTKAGLREGDRVRLIDLVKAAMVNSSNDAAFAIAIYLGGSVDMFVGAMNARARALGMTGTRFTNPAGFDKGAYSGNVSTARDLMRLTDHAVRNSDFNAIASLEEALFTEQVTHRAYRLKTHNKLLDRYPYSVGIKTGYTVRAGRCLIARAVKEKKDLLMVMLDAHADRWQIACDLFDYSFDSGKEGAGSFQLGSGSTSRYFAMTSTDGKRGGVQSIGKFRAHTVGKKTAVRSKKGREARLLALKEKRKGHATAKAARPGKGAVAAKAALKRNGHSAGVKTALQVKKKAPAVTTRGPRKNRKKDELSLALRIPALS